jgi:hypothetical protein
MRVRKLDNPKFTSCPVRAAIKTKDPSTSALRDRFRPHAICHTSSAPEYSVYGQLHRHSHEWPDIWSKPYPLRCGAEIHDPRFDLIRISILGVNVSRAEKLPLFPGYYFLMMANVLRFLSGRATISTVRPLSLMDLERRALLDHAVSTRRGRDFGCECCK